uniref:(northern house mosquito) hypothetical protein n=1 Tax=Culex pipiens TaxID=7175 RepID=A0A8D8BJJ7_CULPI
MYLSMKLGSSAAVAATIFRLSSSSPSAVKTLRLGQCSMLSSNHSPSHHSGSSSRSSGATPREMRSAGFFFPEMWFQWQFSVKRWILATRLATNVVQVAGTPASQRITISESVQKKISGERWQSSRDSMTSTYISAASVVPRSSSFGMLWVFRGATLDLDISGATRM